jgi:bacteriocin-like protein
VNECERSVNKGLFCCRLFLSVRIYGCKRNTADAKRKKTSPQGRKKNEEDMKMNTNTKELSINELEQVSGGEPVTLAAIGLGTACVCLVVEGIKLGKKIYKDVTSK